jgi:phage replication O-like protein O
MMSTTLYNNACAPALANTSTAYPSSDVPANLDINEGNRLQLLPEHTSLIYRRCLDQLALCQLPPRCIRVFCIILNQTLGHSKIEDNMTSTRLDKLTKIRHDHAAQAMKDLAAMRIINHRIGGKYHNWLSINFNFEMWGNLSIAEQYKSNNPAVLLPKKYTETPIDNGLQLDPSKLQNIPSTCTVEDTACDPLLESNTTAILSENITENNSQKIETPVASSVIDKQAVQKLETKLTTLFSKKLSSALETINQTLQGFEKHLSHTVSIQSAQNAALTAKESTSPTVKTDETTERNSAINAVSKESDYVAIETNETTENISTGNTTSDTASTAQPIVSKPEQKQYQQDDRNNNQHSKQCNQSNTQETQEVVVSSDNYVIEIAPFNYPEALDTEQCQALQGLLVKAGDRAQDMLNLLAQRLRNKHSPVVDTASYFASLVHKQQNNTLDFSGLRAMKPIKTAQEKAQDAHFDELKIQHTMCYNGYLHFEKLIKNEMKYKKQSFNEVCESSPLGGIIEDCSNKLTKAKRALDDFLAEGYVIAA